YSSQYFRLTNPLAHRHKKPHPRPSSGQSSGNDSNCKLCQMSWSEGICARLKVLVSSRHNGPARLAVLSSSVAEKKVPISAAEVSIPSFPIRFNNMRLEIERRECGARIIDFVLVGADP